MALTEELVLLRFRGGLLDGMTMQGSGWPPPTEIDAANCVLLIGEPDRYRKVRQSQLPAASPGIARGAEYEPTEDARDG